MTLIQRLIHLLFLSTVTASCTPPSTDPAGDGAPVRDDVTPSVGADNYCDGVVDEGALDADSDGYAPCDASPPQSPCDCDDNDPSRYPGAPETLPEIDQDCDGQLEWVRFIERGASGIANHPAGGYYLADDGADEVQRLSVTGEVLWSTLLAPPNGADGTSANLYPGGSALVAGFSDEGALLAEVSPGGGVQWRATILSEYDEAPYAAGLWGLIPLEDGALAFGRSENDHTEVANAAWVVRLAPDWTKDWEGFYGGSPATRINAVAGLGDLGFILAGWDTTKPYEDPIPWVTHVDRYGSQTWTQNLIVNDDEALGSVVGAFRTSSDTVHLISAMGRLEDDRWAVELNELTAQGDLVRRQRYRAGENDFASRVASTADGGYLVGGTTHGKTGTALLLLKVGPDLEEQWSTEIDPDLGYTFFDVYEVLETPDGGYLLRVNFTDKNNSETYVARMLVKTDSRGHAPLVEALSDWMSGAWGEARAMPGRGGSALTP